MRLALMRGHERTPEPPDACRLCGCTAPRCPPVARRGRDAGHHHGVAPDPPAATVRDGDAGDHRALRRRHDSETCRRSPGWPSPSRPATPRRTGRAVVVMNGTLDDALTITFDGIDSAPVPILIVVTAGPEPLRRASRRAPPRRNRPSPPRPARRPPRPPPRRRAPRCNRRRRRRRRPRRPAPCRPSRNRKTRRAGSASTTGSSTASASRTTSSSTASSCSRIDARPWSSRVRSSRSPPTARSRRSSTSTRVVEGSCQTTLTDPNPHFLDDSFQPIANPDPDFYGTVFAIDRRPGYVRFDYTHPTTPPDDGDKFRVIRIGIFYVDQRKPGCRRAARHDPRGSRLPSAGPDGPRPLERRGRVRGHGADARSVQLRAVPALPARLPQHQRLVVHRQLPAGRRRHRRRPPAGRRRQSRQPERSTWSRTAWEACSAGSTSRTPATGTRCAGSSPATRRTRARRWPTCCSTGPSIRRASSAACSRSAMSSSSVPNRGLLQRRRRRHAGLELRDHQLPEPRGTSHRHRGSRPGNRLRSEHDSRRLLRGGAVRRWARS